MLQILMIIFGGIGLSKGEFKITRNRKVYAPYGSALGLVLFIGGVLGLTAGALGGLILLTSFFGSIIFALIVSKPIDQEEADVLFDDKQKRKPKNESKPYSLDSAITSPEPSGKNL